uniref:SKIP_SNW domain-containing protein n=1 Tax=Heterorhabditis bacteriophora TaxID=37862 RepID=A0A1I7XJL5_HETBA
MDDSGHQSSPYHVVCGARQIPKHKETMILVPRKIIKPESSESGLRRSTRNRMQPARQWLGEKPVYVDSPSGGKRLVGTTQVEVKDNRFLKVRSADPLVVMQREQQNINLDVTVDSIVTSSDEDST